MLEQQVLRISLTRLVTLGHELKMKRGRLRVSSVDGLAASSLVTIRAPEPGSLVPLFLIHPVGGSIIAYYELARHLHLSQPIYAIENQIAFRPELALYATIAEMAERYLQEVQTVQQKGPFLFGGYSMGGIVAFEMARQARERGRAVELVVIIDTPARVRDLGDPPEEAMGARELSTIARMMASRQQREICLSEQDLESLGPDQRLEHLVEVLKREQVLSSVADVSLLRQLLKVVRNNELAQRKYAPQPCDCNLLLLRATEPSPELLAEAADIYDDPTFGWQSACRRPVTVERVKGEHMRMLQAPFVHGLGVVLQRHLDRHQPECVIAPF
jgi:thioesterase domain-containing protein